MTENTLNFHNFALQSFTISLNLKSSEYHGENYNPADPNWFSNTLSTSSYLTVLFFQNKKPCVPLSLPIIQDLPLLSINKAFSDRLRQKWFVHFYGILNVPLLPHFLKGLDGDTMTATHQLNECQILERG